MTENRDLALGMVVLTHAKRTISPALEEMRANANATLRSRETVVAVSPIDGSDLGHITRTNPTEVAFVADEAVLMAHLQEVNPDALYDETIVHGSVTNDQILDVLRAHAPHLLDSVVRITAHDLNHLLKKSEVDGKAAAPGISLRKSDGTTNVYPGKGKAADIEAVIASGRVQLNGAVVPQIEGGSA